MGARFGTFIDLPVLSRRRNTRIGFRKRNEWEDEILTVLLLQAPEDLFETISQALLNAVDRDALSGWGAHVYIIEKDKVTKRLLKGRQD